MANSGYFDVKAKATLPAAFDISVFISPPIRVQADAVVVAILPNAIPAGFAMPVTTLFISPATPVNPFFTLINDFGMLVKLVVILLPILSPTSEILLAAVINLPTFSVAGPSPATSAVPSPADLTILSC